MPLDPNIEYYDIEVNETNIDRYDMESRFNQSRPELLSRAAEAKTEGYTVSVKIPKSEVDAIDQAGGFNIFENFRDEHFDAQRIKHCGYEKREVDDGSVIYVCIIHGKTSNYDVENRPTAPCIQVDPDVKPSKEELEKVLGCRYDKKLDGIRGTIFVCQFHGRESKHDVKKFPQNPCLQIDPLTPEERELTRG